MNHAADGSPPTVTVLSTTPVKGMQLHHPEQVWLDRTGAAGDRDFLLVDEQDRLVSLTRCGELAGWTALFDADSDTLTFRSAAGEEVSGRLSRGRAVDADFSGSHSVPGSFAPGPWDDLLSGVTGRQVRLVRTSSPGTGSDEHPVTLMAEESVAELASRAGLHDVDSRRFRMTIQFRGVAPHTEDTWRERRLRVGDAILRVGGPVPRCAAVTRNPDTGLVDLRTLHMINAYRGRQPNEFGEGLNFGVYAEVLAPGTVRVGDRVALEP